MVFYTSFDFSENTKNVLIAASFIHLKHKEHAKYTTELTTVNPRILLSGPAGLCLICSLSSDDRFLLLCAFISLIVDNILICMPLQGQKYIRKCWQRHLLIILGRSCSYLIVTHFWV